MPRGKNWLPTVSRQFLTRNYPRSNCLLLCLPNCLSPTIEDIFSSFKIAPVVRVIARQLSGKNCLAAILPRGIKMPLRALWEGRTWSYSPKIGDTAGQGPRNPNRIAQNRHPNGIVVFLQKGALKRFWIQLSSGARGPPQFLKKRSENAGANENLSCAFPKIPGIAPRVAPRIVAFALLKSRDTIPRMGFRIPRIIFWTPRAAPRIPRNSPRAPRMAFSLRECFSWNWGGPQASDEWYPMKKNKHERVLRYYEKHRRWTLRTWGSPVEDPP